MSNLAWQILAILMDNSNRVHGAYGRGYLASWTLGEMLGGGASTIDSITVKLNPRNEYESALSELLDLGLVEEMEELHCRYRLAVKNASVVSSL